MSPWLAVVVIAMGLVAIVVFSYFHINEAVIAIAVIQLGIFLLQAKSHVQATTQLKEIRNSMRPPPSLVDEIERKQTEIKFKN
jgi:uncharacterized protein YoxC